MPHLLMHSLPALGLTALLVLSSCAPSANGTGSSAPRTGPGPQADENFPKAYKTDKPGQVISPYPPNNLIDVTRNPKTGQPFNSGDLAVDPSEPNNPRIFRIP